MQGENVKLFATDRNPDHYNADVFPKEDEKTSYSEWSLT